MSSESLLHEPLSIFLAILAVILIAPIFSERLRLPGIVGLVVGGILIGPHGFHVIAEDGIVELFATVGLIYLMFNAGLEIDLGQFSRVRNKAIIFGVLTFGIPLLAGLLLGLLLDYGWLGSILLGSALSSHTLIAFPLLARMGVIANETVAITVGATVFTDVSAFLVLAVITGVSGGDTGIGEIGLLVVLLGIFAAVILVGLPRLGKFLLQHLTGRDVEFQFVLVALFVSAVLAELIGVHGVVGAFLTGLAINSMLPHRSQVLGRLIFVGEALFIPSFLVYSGMITNPGAFLERESLLVGIGMTVIAYLAKLVAALLTSRLYGYNRYEMLTMWGLSQCQAAVTLPTILVGVELDLFPTSVFNGTMMMILATSISSPLLVQRYGKKLRLPQETVRTANLFDRVLLAVSHPTHHLKLMTLMDILVGSKNGVLMPANIALDVNGQIFGLRQQTDILDAEPLRHTETNIQPIRRVDDTLAKGILHAAVEHNASTIALGWRGKPSLRENIFGSVLDEILWTTQIPVLVMRLTEPIDALQQVVMVIAPNSTAVDYLDEMADAAITISDALNVPLLVMTAQEYHTEFCACIDRLDTSHPHDVQVLGSSLIAEVEKQVQSYDLLLLSITGTRQRFQSSLGTLPEQLAARTQASLMVIHYPGY